MKLKQFETLFIENQMNGGNLLEASETDLQELGISIGFQRKNTLKAIEALKTIY